MLAKGKVAVVSAAALVIGVLALAGMVYKQTLSGADARIIVVVYICILLWATAVVPGYLVSLLFFFLAATITTVPLPEIFSGFASSAFWLVFSGGVIGMALQESELSRRIGALLASLTGQSYLRALLVFASLSFVLSLVMPSTFGRIAVLVPIAMGYCDVAGLGRSPNASGRHGILLLVIVASYELAAAVLPANLPNVILAGLLEKAAGLHLSFSEYLYIFLPAGILVRGAILIATSYLMFPASVQRNVPTPQAAPLSRHEIRVLFLLSVMLLLWFTDTVHGIAPGWIGLGFSLAYLLTSPSNQASTVTGTQKMDLLWFVAAIIGLTSLIKHLSLDPMGVLEPGGWATNSWAIYAAIVVASIGVCFLVTSNAEPALVSPFVIRVLGDGLLMKMGLLSQVIGYSTTFLPYQSPPIAFGAALADVKPYVAVRYCLVTAALGVIVVAPTNAIWWWFIGLL